jgi:hypothetical protein
VTSPLLGLVTATPDTDTTRDPLPVPTDLDLPDVKATDVASAKPARKEPKAPAITPDPITTPAGEDVGDWI